LLSAALAVAGDKQVFTGVITDTMCGANHKAMGMGPDADCVRACVKAGGGTKYALYDGKNVYTLSDQATPAKFAAAKVKVTGVLFEKTKIIQVEKIEAAN
jgi:hypothetical protein